jgi:hypothetical protein
MNCQMTCRLALSTTHKSQHLLSDCCTSNLPCSTAPETHIIMSTPYSMHVAGLLIAEQSSRLANKVAGIEAHKASMQNGTALQPAQIREPA